MLKLRGIAWRIFSPSTMFWLLAAWVFMYATLSIWTVEAFGKFMERLPDDLLLQVPFAIFIIVSSVNYVSYVISRVRASWLSAPFWLLAPTGALLFLAGFFMSAVSSESGRIFVGTGSVVQPPWQDRQYVVSKIDTGLKDEFIDMGQGGGLIFKLSPRLFLQGGGQSHEVGIFPPTKVSSTYYHIMDFGLAPGVRISRDGEVLKEGFVIQRLLPPGLRSSFDLSPFPYRFSIKILPEREMIKGGEKLHVYNIKKPAYSVVIEKGLDVVFEGDSTSPIEVDGLSIEFYEPDYWFWLEGSRNPGYMLLAYGIILFAAGVPLLLIAMVFNAHGVQGRDKDPDLPLDG